MKLTITAHLVLLFCLAGFPQQPSDILAVSNLQSFTAQDLSPKIAEAWIKMPATIANARKALLDRQIENTLIEIEASRRKLSVSKLIEDEVEKKVPNPSDAQIKAVYEASRDDIGDAPLSEVRAQIVDYLRQEPEKKAYSSFISSLRSKYKTSVVKDVNLPSPNPNDVLATVGDTNITFKDFKDRNGLVLYEYEANVFDQVAASLTQAVDATLFASEAAGYGISTSDFIAREITNNMREFDDEEQIRLHSALQKKLYEKYRVKFFLNEPDPFVQNIAVDDDPFQGDENAPVTVVMFTDFQCPACAAVHPVLKKVLNEYGSRIRFVVRDFPLTDLHEHAFQAATAANAANAQGKFFEYSELLYKNQDSLDTESLKKMAAELKLDQKRFASDLSSKKFAEEVQKDIEDGDSYGVDSTPTIFVNGIKIRTLSAESFRKAIDRFVK